MNPTKDIGFIEACAQKAGINETEGLRCVRADHGDKPLGYILFRQIGDTVHIEAIDCQGDSPLFDGLVRSVLFTYLDSPVDKACFSDAVDEKLLREWRFIADDTKCISSIDDFMTNCKNCKS